AWHPVRALPDLPAPATGRRHALVPWVASPAAQLLPVGGSGGGPVARAHALDPAAGQFRLDRSARRAAARREGAHRLPARRRSRSATPLGRTRAPLPPRRPHLAGEGDRARDANPVAGAPPRSRRRADD